MHVFKYKLLAQWIPLLIKFTVRYVKELVPHDVPVAIYDSCCNIDLNTLTWPPILVVNADGLVANTNAVNHLGRVTSIMLWIFCDCCWL